MYTALSTKSYDKLYDKPLVIPFTVQQQFAHPQHEKLLKHVSRSSSPDSFYSSYNNDGDAHSPNDLTKVEFTKLRRAVLWVSAISISVQLIFGVVSIVEGLTVDSSGTLGFGLETLADLATSVVIIWRYTGNTGYEVSLKKEFKSVVILTLLLFLLAVGTATGATINLLQKFKPFKEYRLMVICVIGFVVYTFLGWIKLYLGTKIRSKAVYIDGVSTICAACTAIALLASLIVYKLTQLWFLDSIVALIVAFCMFIYSLRLFYKDVYGNFKYFT